MSEPRTLGPWLRRFLAEHIVTERNLARNTQKSYRDTFALLLPFIGARTRKPVDRLAVQELTARRVLQFLAHLEDDRGCSVQTRNQRLTAIRAFARFVASRDSAHLEWSANIRAIALKRATPQPIGWLSNDEMKALLEVPDRRTPRGRIEHALLLFLYNTGASVSEAAELVASDLQIGRRDGEHALVTIHGKGGKIRQCPLWPRTERVLTQSIVDGLLGWFSASGFAHMQGRAVGATEGGSHALLSFQDPAKRGPSGVFAGLTQPCADHLHELVGDHGDEQVTVGANGLVVIDRA